MLKRSIIAIIIFLLLTSCSKKSPVSETIFALDTFVTITLYNSNEEILKNALDMCVSYENLFSRTIKTSDIYKINNSGGKAVEVSAETIELLKKCGEFYLLSDGVFDAAIGSVTELWKFSDNSSPPDAAVLKEAVSHIGFKNIIITESHVALRDTQTKLDVGGIAKGYIADKIAAYLKSLQPDIAAIIDLGGNIVTVGEKSKNSKERLWNVGIKNPFGESLSGILELSECSVVSSGAYQRYFTFQGKTYHHILDTKTGMPVESDVAGVTVITKSSADGDALSTILFCKGVGEGLAFAESLDGVEAVFIGKDGKMSCTSGAAQLLK